MLALFNKKCSHLKIIIFSNKLILLEKKENHPKAATRAFGNLKSR